MTRTRPAYFPDTIEWANGVTVRRLTAQGGRVDWYKGPAHQLIAFDRFLDPTRSEVFTMEPDGAERRCITCENPEIPKGFTGQPTATAWFPEWIVPGIGAIDRNQLGELMDHNQWQAAFGISGFAMELPLEMTDYGQIANGIEEAGPTLTPATFEKARFGVGDKLNDDPVRAIGRGFGPTTPTWTTRSRSGGIPRRTIRRTTGSARSRLSPPASSRTGSPPRSCKGRKGRS